MSLSAAGTSTGAMDIIYSRYRTMVESESYTAATTTLPTVWLLTTLLVLQIDTRQMPFRRLFRTAVWLCCVCMSAYNLLYVRARNPAVTYCVGLVSIWMTIWMSVLFVIADPQKYFKRIKRRSGRRRQVTTSDLRKDTNGSDMGLRQRRPDPAQRAEHLQDSVNLSSEYSVYWQSFPEVFSWERLDWTCDLFFNFRGIGWNWCINNLPPLPKTMLGELEIPQSNVLARPAKYRNPDEGQRICDSRTLLNYAVWGFIRDYFIIDIIKTLGMHDPWFWGATDAPPPPFLPALLQQSPVIVRIARLIICVAAMRTALEYTFNVGPLFYIGVLGPWIGVRGEPWMYPDTFGSFRAVFDKGLSGWWSGWWHQMFRYGFDAPGRKVVAVLGLDYRSTPAKMLQLTVAFALSASIHAAGGHTQLGRNHPLRGPVIFLALQILGIASQLALTSLLRRTAIAQRTPQWIVQAANFFLVHTWFYFTASFLLQDIAAGGLWLYEPLPLSPLRGLGLGPKDGGGLVRWSFDSMWWHSGKHWWDTGFAI